MDALNTVKLLDYWSKSPSVDYMEYRYLDAEHWARNRFPFWSIPPSFTYGPEDRVVDDRSSALEISLECASKIQREKKNLAERTHFFLPPSR